MKKSPDPTIDTARADLRLKLATIINGLDLTTEMRAEKDYLTDRLYRCIEEYRLNKKFKPPPPEERRKQFKNLHDAIDSLGGYAFGELYLWLSVHRKSEEKRWHIMAGPLLTHIAQGAAELSTVEGKRGPSPITWFRLELADIYYLGTQHAPTRRLSVETGENYGPFFNFIKDVVNATDLNLSPASLMRQACNDWKARSNQ